MNAIIIMLTTESLGGSMHINYFPGAIISVFVLGYLIYTLIKPERF